MSVTLSVARARLAEMLGRYASTATTGTPTGFDAARQVISSYVRNDDADPEDYAHGWVYVPTNVAGNQQRRILDHGFLRPDMGMLRTVSPFTAALTSGTAFEYSEWLPFSTAEGVAGLREVLNMAARDLWVPDQLSRPTAAGARSYSLATYSEWLSTAPGRVLRILDPPLVTGYPPQDGTWRSPRIDAVGTTLSLLLKVPYAANGEMFKLDVKRPAYTSVNGAESTVGFAADSDTIMAELDDLVNVGLLHAYRVLSMAATIPASDRERFGAMIDPQEARVRRLEHYLGREQAATEKGA